MKKTFFGGIHPPYEKGYTAELSIREMKAPQVVAIPLQQHIGAPCTPIVKAGDEVKVGQRIGEPGGFVSAPVHSSVSGKVTKIDNHISPVGGKVQTVFIENDGKYELYEGIKPKGNLETLSSNEIIEIIKDAGITGMGGASFPTHVKLSPPEGKKIDVLLINGAECEPYLSSDHRLMVEQPEEIMFGVRALMKALSVGKAIFCIEDNKLDAAQKIKGAAEEYPSIEVMIMESKYPQGSEKQLIYAATGREVPSGGLPMDVGAVVNNIGTARAVARAIKEGMPVIERVVTVNGPGVKNPSVLMVKIGTFFKDVIEECGGFVEDPGKVIMGGPMMGLAQFDLDVPVVKGSSGILVMDTKTAKEYIPTPCIRCGKCVAGCPVYLMPFLISAYSLEKDFNMAKAYNAMDCIECGCCSYVCPARRPLVHSIRVAKKNILIREKRKKQ
jgi:electron transport complex protein RnfC